MLEYTIILTNLSLNMEIGVYQQEHGVKQEVLVSVKAKVQLPNPHIEDNIDNVLNYATIKNQIEAIAAKGHIHLVESFADMILSKCMEDKRIKEMRVRVEKTEIFDNAEKVGVEFKRRQA
ncbi:MAG: dihydroneopterin aldolase [Alphaproteobacteria bacterium]|nr:dihydroneopterin aldolase [Alphaproteobacteria bacterium]|tara:strand:- start:866 stop:1225 length:360 start_codon:yes stop_codon:yes gene_type:complete